MASTTTEPTSARPPAAARGRRVAVVAAVAAAVAAALWAYGNRHNFFDLRIYVSAMRWWADGNDLYAYAQPDRVQGELYFTYPPFAALLLRPFADLPIGVTIAVFSAGTALAIGLTTWWLVGPLADARGWPRWYAAGLAVPLVFLIEPTRETITFGQINMLLILLVVGDLIVAVPRKWRLAGAGIGLATALKLFPGIFIVYLLVTRRWRAAIVASATAAGATLLAAATAPRASWQFWTDALWSTDRVGRTDYTGNQSLQGLLARLTAPAEPPRLAWLLLAVAVAGFGLWRAARARDEITGMALTGLVAALISPITWPHHVYWFVPAVLALVVAASAPVGRRRRVALFALAIGVYATAAVGVVSFLDFGTAPEPTDGAGEFLLRNAYVLVALVLLVMLPTHIRSAPEKTDLPIESV
jgi:alpha-1,2-mannosyltransferase